MVQGYSRGPDTEAVEVLLVEDNPGDVELTHRILQDSKFELNINVVGDGEEAMAYLAREGDYISAPRPDLILLDLNMPKMDGYQVLEQLRAQPAFQNIMVMILTSTAAEGDLIFEMGIHPSRFCNKPLDITQFDALVRNLHSGAVVQETQTVAQTLETEASQKKWWWPFGN